MPQQDKAPNVLELLYGLRLPSSREERVEYAAANDASEESMEILRLMPDQHYADWQQINDNLGKIQDLPASENLWSSHREESLYSPNETIASRMHRSGGKVS